MFADAARIIVTPKLAIKKVHVNANFVDEKTSIYSPSSNPVLFLIFLDWPEMLGKPTPLT